VPPFFLGGGAGSPSNTVAWAEAYFRTKWYPDPSSRLATIGMGLKVGGAAVPLSVERGAESSANTMSPEPRPTSVPSRHDPCNRLAIAVLYINIIDMQTDPVA